MRIYELDGRRSGGFEGSAGAVAIGNFDGVHLGHQEVVRQVIRSARGLELPASVMTFEPYPREYFNPKSAPPRLTGCRQKFELLEAAGIERVYCARFGRKLASTPAGDFVEEILVARLGVRQVTVGIDFRFGAGRKGDIELLRRMGREHEFSVAAIEDFSRGGARVSSSRIRHLLAEGDLDAAADLLGRPFSYKARVIHGDKRGRSWGFPTANLPVRRNSFPLKGVFVVRLEDQERFVAEGVANVGMRPTVDGTRLLVEVHLFDVSPDLYGRRVEVIFLKRIREEQRFDSFDALKAQIGRDVAFARSWLEARDSSAKRVSDV